LAGRADEIAHNSRPNDFQFSQAFRRVGEQREVREVGFSAAHLNRWRRLAEIRAARRRPAKRAVRRRWARGGVGRLAGIARADRADSCRTGWSGVAAGM